MSGAPEELKGIARNEARFREYNDAVDADAEERRRKPQPLVFFCECGHAGCQEFVAIGADEYERVRSSARRFIVLPAHQIRSAEIVVDRREGYLVVEKREELADIVEATDPRRWDR